MCIIGLICFSLNTSNIEPDTSHALLKNYNAADDVNHLLTITSEGTFR